MSRLLLRSVLAVSLMSSLVTTGCAPAYADRVARPSSRVLVPMAIAPEAVRSPYQVEIVGDGDTLDTFFHRGRYYVHGASGQHYAIRVSNPTPHRIEAVVSVDGIDVIDGETGDMRKRGYVVPPYGEVVIDGWRTSLTDVASFQFSSVSGSYAGKKGKARNVGVIAVALFAEDAPPPPPQIILDDQPYYQGDGYGDEVEGYLDRRAPAGGGVSKSSGGSDREDRGGGSGRVSAKRPAPSAPHDSVGEADAPSAPTSTGAVGGALAPSAPPRMQRDECCPAPPTRERLGLGTEFGEQRYSAASYTKFSRSSDRPVAIAELRYNDTGGLQAMGILVEQLPDEGELMTRETADPFPGDRGFARPPAGIR